MRKWLSGWLGHVWFAIFTCVCACVCVCVFPSVFPKGLPSRQGSKALFGPRVVCLLPCVTPLHLKSTTREEHLR